MVANRRDSTLADAGRAITTARNQLTAPLPGAIRDPDIDNTRILPTARRPDPAVQPTLEAPVTQRPMVGGRVLSRATLRQAILLTEILGPPKALRRSE
jgi:hypothetical protein